MAISCMLLDPLSADAVYVRALCIYNKDLDQALQCFKNVLILDPDHKKTKVMITKIKKYHESEEQGEPIQSFINS